jgi:hypothetical protein
MQERCVRCGKETVSWDLIGDMCTDCLDWIKNNPEEAKREITDIQGEILHYELYKKEETERSIKELSELIDKCRQAIEKLRAYLGEKGYELTYEELEEVLGAMDDMKIEVTPASVLEFMKEWRT